MSCGVVDLGNPPVELVVEDLSYPESVVEAVQNGTSITFIYNAVNAEMGNASLRCSAGTSIGHCLRLNFLPSEVGDVRITLLLIVQGISLRWFRSLLPRDQNLSDRTRRRS